MMSVVFSQCSMMRERARSEAINGEGYMQLCSPASEQVLTDSSAKESIECSAAREGPSTIQHPVWSVMYVLLDWSCEHEEHESYLGGRESLDCAEVEEMATVDGRRRSPQSLLIASERREGCRARV